MTIQLAIQFFKKHMPIITRRNPYAGPKTFMTWVFQEAISALEKQMPMQITEVHVDEYICPACGAENSCEQGIVEDKFCPECGQALDWSD